MKIDDIDDTQEDEFRGMNVILGNVENESNGNRERKKQSVYLVETVIVQKYGFGLD
jgi:hypothetical protein